MANQEITADQAKANFLLARIGDMAGQHAEEVANLRVNFQVELQQWQAQVEELKSQIAELTADRGPTEN